MKLRVKAIFLVLLMSLLIIIFNAISPEKEEGLKIGKPPRVEEYRQTALRKSPPIVSLVVGGLGNQLFQYAAAYSVAKKRNADLYVCIYAVEGTMKTVPSSYTSNTRQYVFNQFYIPQKKLLFLYQLDSFNLSRFREIECGIDYYLNGKKVENHVVTEEDVLKGQLPDDKVLMLSNGFESDVFFGSDKSDILNSFQPTFDTRPIEHLKLLISSAENSVSVHIRRGDFSYEHRIISLSYQREAMQLIKQKLQTNNVTFFVFTDDIDYVKKRLDDGQNDIIYVSDLTEQNLLYDFVLMSLCKHNIITNSTFSWWAAYLNKNVDKMVVAPLPRYSSEWIDAHCASNHCKKMISDLAYPKEWLTITPKFLNHTDLD